MIYLGSHVSFKSPNYFKGAIEEALSYGANACMIYTGPCLVIRVEWMYQN